MLKTIQTLPYVGKFFWSRSHLTLFNLKKVSSSVQLNPSFSIGSKTVKIFLQGTFRSVSEHLCSLNVVVTLNTNECEV